MSQSMRDLDGPATSTAPLYRIGDRGEAVREIRSRLALLGLTADGRSSSNAG
jgi:peptidoglycan hydrolase-like protein with peptidoglycan-binding domain